MLFIELDRSVYVRTYVRTSSYSKHKYLEVTVRLLAHAQNE